MLREGGYPVVSQEARAIEAYAREDEISLIDLWLVLVRRRRIVYLTVSLSILLGFVFYLVTPRLYEYSATIEIGTTDARDVEGERTVLIDPPETVLAKINESYIPWVQHRHMQEHPEDKKIYELKAEIPQKSQLIVIKGKGPEESEPMYLAMLNEVMQRLFQDHGRQTGIIRASLQAQLTAARNKLAALEDPATLAVQRKSLENELASLRIRMEELQDPLLMTLQVQKLETEMEQKQKKLANLENQVKHLRAQYKRLDRVDELLKGQISNLNTEIETAIELRRGLVSGVKDTGMAMAVLLIDNEIQQNRRRLAALEERYYIKQKNTRAELLNKIEDNLREQEVVHKLIERIQGELKKLKSDNQRQRARLEPQIALMKEKINKLVADHQRTVENQRQLVQALEVRINSIKETRALIEPVRSLNPVGHSGKLILALAVIFGLMLGIFSAFFLEFLSKARQRMQEQENQESVAAGMASKG